MNGIEATALAIFCFESGHLNDPTLPAIRNLNPGNLRTGVNPDANGYSVFPDFVTGYSALLRDLRAKFDGNNAHGLGHSSTLLSLLGVYAPAGDSNNPSAYASFVAGWVGKALGKPITVESELCNIWQAPSNNASDVQASLSSD